MMFPCSFYITLFILSLARGHLIRENHRQKRMFGGVDVDRNSKYPFVVHLDITNVTERGYVYHNLCTGVLIKPNAILTSAHCFGLKQNDADRGMHTLPTGVTVKVRAGSPRPLEDARVQEQSVSSIRIHPLNTSLFTSDLVTALVPADFPAYMTNYLSINESLNWRDPCWDECVTMGWGYWDFPYFKFTTKKWGIEYAGHEYKHFREKTTWIEAKRKCESENAYLADIRTEAENMFLAFNRSKDMQLEGVSGTWIGLKRDGPGGAWGFVHEDEITESRVGDYRGFGYLQPKNTDAHCASMSYASATGLDFGKWTNEPCDEKGSDFWCEIDWPAKSSIRSSQPESKTLKEMPVSLKKDIPAASGEIPAQAVDNKHFGYRHTDGMMWDETYRVPLKGDDGAPLVCKRKRENLNAIDPPWHLLGINQGGASIDSPLFYFVDINEVEFD